MDTGKSIRFYGAMWCGDCQRAKKFLDRHKIAYEFHDTDNEKGAMEAMLAANNGVESIPTIVFPDGRFLVEPSNSQLREALNKTKLEK